ncbi:class I SAM-dependent methyltransferase [Microbispora siamensis]
MSHTSGSCLPRPKHWTTGCRTRSSATNTPSRRRAASTPTTTTADSAPARWASPPWCAPRPTTTGPRSFLADHPDAVVLHLGCGLDARVYRIDPPATVDWYDLDYPPVIELRQQFLPPREHYTLIGSSVTDLTWLALCAYRCRRPFSGRGGLSDGPELPCCTPHPAYDDRRCSPPGGDRCGRLVPPHARAVPASR